MHAGVEEGEQAERAAILRQCAEAEELPDGRDRERDGKKSKGPEPGADLRIANLIGPQRAAPSVEQPKLGKPVECEQERGNEAEQEDQCAYDGMQQKLRSRPQKFLRRSMPRYRLAT